MKNKKSSVPKAKVAVIVPCFNLGEYLGECLESVRHQSFTDWVCIIVDDGSKDNTPDVANHYCDQDSRFHYLKQKNSGVARARNNGIDFCQSDFILTLDADDYLGYSFLEKTVKIAEGYPDVKVVYTNIKLFGLVNKTKNLPEYLFSKILRDNIIIATALFRRQDYERTTGYDKLLKKLEDWDFWLSLLDSDSMVVKLPEDLFFYRQRKGSRNTCGSSKQTKRIRKYIYYKHIDKYRAFHDDPEVLNYRIQIMENEIEEYRNSWLFELWSLMTKLEDWITLLLSSLKKYLRSFIRRSKEKIT